LTFCTAISSPDERFGDERGFGGERGFGDEREFGGERGDTSHMRTLIHAYRYEVKASCTAISSPDDKVKQTPARLNASHWLEG
jgi:hypothetical protein